MLFTLCLLSNLLLCRIVVCSLFFSHSHQSPCFVSYYHRLRKPVGLQCILLSQPTLFFRRDKKPIKKKPTKKKGELPDKPTKVTTSRLLTKITNLSFAANRGNQHYHMTVFWDITLCKSSLLLIVLQAESSGVKFPESKGAGVYLRSSRVRK